MLKRAGVLLENEKEEKIRERKATLSERVPPLTLSGLSVQDLQVCAGSLSGHLGPSSVQTWMMRNTDSV